MNLSDSEGQYCAAAQTNARLTSCLSEIRVDNCDDSHAWTRRAPFVVGCVASALISISALGQTYHITTVAGHAAVRDGAPTNEVLVRGIAGITINSQGSVLVSSTEEHKIFHISDTKIISTAAGTGTAGYSEENQIASSTELSAPTGVAAREDGSIWFIDSGNFRVRKIAADGTITTVAGNGELQYSDADNVAATATSVKPTSIAPTRSGELLLCEQAWHRIRSLGTDGVIRTIAGNGQEGFSADGVPANQARLSSPYAVAVGPDNLIYFTESGSNRVRFIDASGILRTLAGSGIYGYSPDGELATRADLSNPGALSIGSDGAVVFVERDLALLRSITPDGRLTTWIQSGLAELPGIVSTAVTGRISDASVVAVWGDKLFIGDSSNLYSIRRSSRVVELFLDNPPIRTEPTQIAILNRPTDLYFDNNLRTLLVADTNNNFVREIGEDGVSHPVAGDGGTSSEMAVIAPLAVKRGQDGSLLIASLDRLIRHSNGEARTFAGAASDGFSGDGGPATAARMRSPSSITFAGGHIFIADYGNHRIRAISPDGNIRTIAGNGFPEASGDGGAATLAGLDPFDICAAPDGTIYVADLSNHRVRRISPTGTITTVAGTGEAGFGGDLGASTEALLAAPTGVALDGEGNLFVADFGNNRIRRISTSGVITTIAGNGEPGSSGDEGPALAAALTPFRIAVSSGGYIYFTDYSQDRVRFLYPSTATSQTREASVRKIAFHD